jgi:hypothetical protein
MCGAKAFKRACRETQSSVSEAIVQVSHDSATCREYHENALR